MGDPDDEVRCPVGTAVVTTGGDLKAAYCVHAVGPNYNTFGEGEVEEADGLLRAAYIDSMRVARRERDPPVKTIAFSLLSAGVFRGE